MIGRYVRCVNYKTKEIVDEDGDVKTVNDGVESSFTGKVIDAWTNKDDYLLIIIDDKTGAVVDWLVGWVHGEPDTFLIATAETPYRGASKAHFQDP
jgi:hypothetical protein